ncbi:hypothetical protein [Haloarcula salina]|uniref:Uncharacterized protein n=1 Tax=Haloarcula salina TaxID=1429914 RepID=A0AA41KJN3_9EURY|nr:hypothetical protein [Haloarcula salina]MBV0901059.1 hypothetical protein [Haloarcula salina]
MAPQDTLSTRKHALVAALQWGLVQTFILDTLGRLLRNYYRATSDAFFPPDWVMSLQLAAPLGLLIGGIGGYRWVTSGRAVASPSAHRNRVVFVGALVAGWAVAIVPEIALQWLLGDRLFSIPYFVIPTLTAVSVFVGSYLLAYRVGTDWYHRWRPRLLGAIQGAVVGMLVGLTGFVVYGQYLIATQDNYSLDGGPGIVAAVCLGAIIGSVLTDTDQAGTRSAEFIALLIPSLFASNILTGLGIVALSVIGIPTLGSGSMLVPVLAPVLLSLGVASYLAYGAHTMLHRRFVN